VLIVVVVIAVAGYFVFKNMHQNSLSGTGQVVPVSNLNPGSVVSSGSGTPNLPDKNPNDGKGDGTDSRCLDGAPLVALTATLGMPIASIPSSVTTGTGGVSNGHWLNFMLKNPMDCPTAVNKVTVHLDTNDMTGWPPVQNVKLMHAGTQLGSTEITGSINSIYISGAYTLGTHTITVASSAGFEVGHTVLISDDAINGMGTVTAIPSGTTITLNITTAAVGVIDLITGLMHAPSMLAVVGSRDIVFSFPSTPVTIAPHGMQLFRVISDSRNVNANEYPGIPAVSATSTGTPGITVYFKMQLKEFASTSIAGTNDQFAPSVGFPSTIWSSIINIY
jgi:hypothetical protein